MPIYMNMNWKENTLTLKMGEKFLSSVRNCILLVACFVISLTVLGTSRLSTLMFVACMDRYETGRKQASFPFFLLGATRCITGPLVGYLGKKLGSEVVTLFGCILAILGVSTCFLAEDILGVTISWGIMYGIGIGLGTSLIPAILSGYFVQHIDKANGFFLGGECFGAIILPSITHYLLREYGTSGTFLVLSGILLHSLPAALVLWCYKKKRISTLTINKILTKTSGKDDEVFLTAAQQKNGVYNSLPSFNKGSPPPFKRTCQYQNNDNRVCTSLPKLEPYITDKDPIEGFSSSLQNISEQSNLSKVQSMPDPTFKPIVPELSPDATSINKWTSEEIQDSTQLILKDTIPSTDIKNTNPVSKDITRLTPDGKNIPASEDPDAGTKLVPTRLMTLSGKTPPEDTVPSRSMFRVFVDPTFLLILVTQSASQFALTTIFTIAVDYFRDAGAADHEHVTLLMGFAVADTVGRFTLGGFTDSGMMGKVHFYVLCHVLIGCACVAFAWAEGFASVMAVCCGCGFFTGGLMMISPGIVTLFVEKRDVMMAMASRYTLFPVLSFTQPFLIGYFRENLGSYNGLFYLICGLNFTCGFLSLLIPVTARLRDSKNRINSTTNQDHAENNC